MASPSQVSKLELHIPTRERRLFFQAGGLRIAAPDLFWGRLIRSSTSFLQVDTGGARLLSVRSVTVFRFQKKVKDSAGVFGASIDSRNLLAY